MAVNPYVFFGASLSFAIILATANELLRRHAAHNPKSCLRQQNHRGILCMEAWSYLVSGGVQCALIPLWACAYFTRPPNWWFGGHVNFAGIMFGAILVGYYLQDSIVYWYENSLAILAHHVGTVILISICFLSDCWHGIFVTAGLVYEMGSLGMGLVDLGLMDRWFGPWSMIGTTVGGLGIVGSAFVRQSPCDGYARAAVAFFVFGGLARLNQSRSYLSQTYEEESEPLVKATNATPADDVQGG